MRALNVLFIGNRIWLRNQTSGDLDDAKLVDGVSGERNIYKRRGEASTRFGAPPVGKKRLLHFVVDISGSMCVLVWLGRQ